MSFCFVVGVAWFVCESADAHTPLLAKAVNDGRCLKVAIADGVLGPGAKGTDYLRLQVLCDGAGNLAGVKDDGVAYGLCRGFFPVVEGWLGRCAGLCVCVVGGLLWLAACTEEEPSCQDTDSSREVSGKGSGHGCEFLVGAPFDAASDSGFLLGHWWFAFQEAF